MYMWVRHFAVGVLLITSVSPCYSTAIDKMRTLAEQGDSTAQYELGRSYMEGRNNLPKSDTEAYYWYRKAAEQGNAEAQTALANLLEVGVGTSKNMEEARLWFRKAADQGFPRAQGYLCRSLVKGKGG